MSTDLKIDDVIKTKIHDFYNDYYATLDDLNLDDWPNFFTQDCLYRIIPRENYDRGYTLCTMQAESRGMLIDRVTGLTETQMYAPRIYRRFPSPLRICEIKDDYINVRQNLLIIQTLVDKQPNIVLCGVCYDKIKCDNEKLYFQERIVVIDSEMIANSLIYPA